MTPALPPPALPPPALQAPALQLVDLHKRFGTVEIIRGVTLDIAAGERHAVIGPNGAGKSTLFNLVSGRLRPSSGQVLLNNRRIDWMPPHGVARSGLSRSFQVSNLFPRLTVWENLRCAVLRERGYGLGLGRLVGNRADVNGRCAELAESVGLLTRRNVAADALSYAELRALELAVTVAGNAPVILLDEPTAGMSRSETAAALALIRRVSEGRTLVVVEHDMTVVFGLADRISVLVYGRVLATGTPDAIRADPAVREAYLGSAVDET